MKQSPASVKCVKSIMLLIGLFLLISSGVLDELSSKDPDCLKFSIGMLLIVVASMKRIKQTIRECF